MTADRKDWMRAAGAGLMGLSQHLTTNRKLAADELRNKNLHDISLGRNDLMREELGLMRERGEAQTRRLDLSDQDTAIEKVQTRLDSLLEPGDMEIREYMQQRAMIVKNSAEMTGDELADQLKAVENMYRDNQLAGMDPESEEGKARKREVANYIKRVNNVLDVGNRNMKRAFGEDFTGDVTDYVHLDPEAAYLQEDVMEGYGPVGERVVTPDPVLDPSPEPVEDPYRDWPVDRSPEVQPFSGFEGLLGRIGITKTRPLHERMGRPPPPDVAADPMQPAPAPVTRGLRIDDRGNIITPGAGLMNR